MSFQIVPQMVFGLAGVAVAEVLGQVDRRPRPALPSRCCLFPPSGSTVLVSPARQRGGLHLDHVGSRGQAAEEVLAVLVGGGDCHQGGAIGRRYSLTVTPSSPSPASRLPLPSRSRKTVSPIRPSPASCPAGA